jgi:hypothetical protein
MRRGEEALRGLHLAAYVIGIPAKLFAHQLRGGQQGIRSRMAGRRQLGPPKNDILECSRF